MIYMRVALKTQWLSYTSTSLLYGNMYPILPACDILSIVRSIISVCKHQYETTMQDSNHIWITEKCNELNQYVPSKYQL